MATPASDISMLELATIFLGAAIIIVPLGKRLGIATVLGYLLTGLIISTLLPNLNSADILHFAEFGVVLLLFIIGLELQPSRLWALRRSIFMLGGLQMGITGAGIMVFMWLVAGRPLDTSFIVGMGLALSSTAFVLQILTEKQQLGSTHGREAFSILLFQDMAVIPLLAILPLLSGAREQHYDVVYFATVIGVFAGLIFVSRFVVRPFFKFVAQSGAQELLTAIALFIVIGVSMLMHKLDISMALGAFLTGVLLADSEYRHELESSIEPFKGLLLGLFFISVGMVADVKLVATMPLVIVGGAMLLMVFKFAVLAVIARLSGNRIGPSIRLGVVLAQGGEFAFVVFSAAMQQGVLSKDIMDILLMVVTMSMALTPLAFWLLERFIEPRLVARTPAPEYDQIPEHEHPVIIAGFGRFGQIIGRVLRMHNIEFTAIEKSIHRVDFVRKFGNEIYYGDPNNPELLRAAGIAHTKLFILAIDNVERSIKTAHYLHTHYPNLTIMARARDRQHYYRLREAGVKLIWRETYLTSVDLAREALTILGIPADKARKSVDFFREYDERLIERQRAVYDDEASLIESAKAANNELESLFDSDHHVTVRHDSVNNAQ